MKYAISGFVDPVDSDDVVLAINSYELWRLITNTAQERTFDEFGIALPSRTLFNFEVWLNTEADKDALFAQLKAYVLYVWENISWHECTHDEPVPSPCVIAEQYVGTLTE